MWGLDRYRRELGWPVDECEGGVVLRLGEGIGAVKFPAGRGRDVITLLRARDMLGPVLALPGRQLRWVFLTTPGAPGAGTDRTHLAGARVRSTATVALPPATTPRGPVRWIVAPPEGLLPRLSVVVTAGWQAVTVR